MTTTSRMPSLLRANWKLVVTTIIWTLVVLNAVFFVRRTVTTDNCRVDAVINQRGAVQDADTAALGDGCTFARNASRIGDPPETNWCMYDDEVDLRIVVMTFNRPASLLRLLRFVAAVEKKETKEKNLRGARLKRFYRLSKRNIRI